MIDMNSIHAGIREDTMELAWINNIFIDENVWFNISFELLRTTFIELLPNSTAASILANME